MKRCIAIVALLALCTSIFAQDPFRTKKYRGFADVGLSVVATEGQSAVSFALTTSHGYQVNPYLFLGAGVGVGVSGGSSTSTEVSVPIFGQTRINFTTKRISPYLDFKGGYDVGDFKGGILSPSFGISMPVSNYCAIDFGISYSCKLHRWEDIGWNYKLWGMKVIHSVSIDFGFEF